MLLLDVIREVRNAGQLSAALDLNFHAKKVRRLLRVILTSSMGSSTSS